VNYEIVELSEFSGSKATIYSVIVNDDDITLFDYFVNENMADYKEEVENIANRLEVIGNTTGARERFFKHKEGKPGDGVCALFDDPNSKLRLYCIRYGNVAIILGGGGVKPSEIKAWEEDAKLTLEAEEIIKLSKFITQRLQSKDLQWSIGGYHLEGELKFSENDD
jgi:hypothetical protein